jgi:hypothetical protein
LDEQDGLLDKADGEAAGKTNRQVDEDFSH